MTATVVETAQYEQPTGDVIHLDSISTLPRYPEPTFQIRARSGSSPSIGSNASDTRSLMAGQSLQDSDAGTVAQDLTSRFQSVLRTEADPKLILPLLTRYIKDYEIWLCLCAAYPDIWLNSQTLLAAIREVDRVMCIDVDESTEEWLMEYIQRRVSGTWLVRLQLLIDYQQPFAEWDPLAAELQDSLDVCRIQVSNMTQALDVCEGGGLLVSALSRQLTHLAQLLNRGVEQLQQRRDKRLASEQANVASRKNSASGLSAASSTGETLLNQPFGGIQRLQSWSTSVEASVDQTSLGFRRGYWAQQVSLAVSPSQFGHQHRSRPQRTVRKLTYDPRILKAQLLSFVKHNVTVYSILAFGFIFSVITTAFAVRKCISSPNAPTPNYDSNFYSTLSQTVQSILGVFTNLIPLVRRDREVQPKIPVAWPLVFWVLMLLSFLTAWISSAVYPYQAPASIIIAYVSTAAQIAATLQLIIGTSNRITQQTRSLNDNAVAISDLNVRNERLNVETEFLRERNEVLEDLLATMD